MSQKVKWRLSESKTGPVLGPIGVSEGGCTKLVGAVETSADVKAMQLVTIDRTFFQREREYGNRVSIHPPIQHYWGVARGGAAQYRTVSRAPERTFV